MVASSRSISVYSNSLLLLAKVIYPFYLRFFGISIKYQQLHGNCLQQIFIKWLVLLAYLINQTGAWSFFTVIVIGYFNIGN